jgi:hypothetical protein
MAVDDFLTSEVAIAAGATAALLSAEVRRAVRKGAVYGTAGVLYAGETVVGAVSGTGRAIGRGVSSGSSNGPGRSNGAARSSPARRSSSRRPSTTGNRPRGGSSS